MGSAYSLVDWVAARPLIGFVLALALACSAAPQRSSTQVVPKARTAEPSSRALPLDPRVVTGTLENGVTYYLKQHDVTKRRVHFMLAVKAGSLYEDDDQRGFAHFVEHMAFNGTRRFEKRSLVDFFERIGITIGKDANAFTLYDRTQFQFVVPSDNPQQISTALDVLEDWAGGVTFDADEVQKERPVLLSEWLNGQNAARRVTEQQFQLLLAGSRYAERKVIGDKTVLESGSRDRLIDFYRQWYRPDRMAVIAVGDIDPAALRLAIERHFSKLVPQSQPGVLPSLDIPARPGVSASVITDPERQATTVDVLFKLPALPAHTEADYQTQLLSVISAHALHNRLTELAIDPTSPFTSAASVAALSLFGHLDLLNVTARAKEGQALQSLRTLLVEIERVKKHGFLAAEVERAVGEYTRLLDHQMAAEQTTPGMTVASTLANQFVTGNIALSVEYQKSFGMKLLRTLRAADLTRAASRIFDTGEELLLVSGATRDGLPQKDALLAALAQVQQQPIAPYAAPTDALRLMTQLPTPGSIVHEEHIAEIDTTIWSLSNGATVVLKPTEFKHDEILEQSVSFGGTSQAAPAEFPSIRFAHEIVMASGVGALNRLALTRALARKVVSAYPWIGEQDEGIRARSTPQDAETMFQLIHLYATAPRRDEAAFELYRTNLRENLRNRDLNPVNVLSDAISKELWGNEPRRMSPTLQSLDGVSLDTALSFYRQRFADLSDFSFVFVGKIDLAAFRPLVERYLASLPGGGRKEMWHDLGLHRRKGITKVHVQSGTEQKATLNLIYHGESPWSENAHTDLDSVESYLAVRLPEVLREEIGGVYQVFVKAEFHRVPFDAYSLSISFDCKPTDLDKLAQVTQNIIAEVKKSGVAASYVEKIRSQRTRHLDEWYRTNELWLERLVEKYKLKEDPRDILILHELTKRVTSDNIRRAARHFLRNDQFVDARRLPTRSAE